MAELKTKRTKESVGAFLKKIPDPVRRRDCVAVKRMMEQATRSKAAMWGASIVGFGTYRYRYPSGQTGEWMLTGFSPRKQALTLYIMAGFGFKKGLMRKLGKHKTGGSCLYIKTLADVDTKILDQLIRASVKYMKTRSA
jgi:uncharacterized protein DUF1801